MYNTMKRKSSHDIAGFINHMTIVGSNGHMTL